MLKLYYIFYLQLLYSLTNTQDRHEGLQAEIVSIREKTEAEKVVNTMIEIIEYSGNF